MLSLKGKWVPTASSLPLLTQASPWSSQISSISGISKSACRKRQELELGLTTSPALRSHKHMWFILETPVLAVLPFVAWTGSPALLTWQATVSCSQRSFCSCPVSIPLQGISRGGFLLLYQDSSSVPVGNYPSAWVHPPWVPCVKICTRCVKMVNY